MHYPGFDSYEPWEYALLGAAAFSTGVTRYANMCVVLVGMCICCSSTDKTSYVYVSLHVVSSEGGFTKHNCITMFAT